VSRKNVSSTIDPSSTSSTWSAHGSNPLPVSLGLYCPNAGEPFAAGAGTMREPLQPIPGPNHQRGCRRPRSHVVRRHRLGRVLVHDGRDRPVVRSNASTPREQVGVGLLHRGRGGLRREVVRVERGACRWRAVDGGDARLGSSLPPRPSSADLAEDEDGRAGAEMLERRDEGEAHRLAGGCHLRGRRRDDQRPAGSIQVTSGNALRLADRLAGRADPSGGAALATGDHVETDVRGDAVEPGAERGASLEAVDRLPGRTSSPHGTSASNGEPSSR
jgi:hypothetical protein